ncbi:DEAD/DEAH box helicase [Thalassotalea agarivorans]|uniref:DEAD-box ATP-dependent RNA helicase RhpA n=1 Tax=Thalassotalea agarivorans TaxID=349064 RepID=A0A1I0EDR0_THASX|nr:DEAD/DEAH box helicase [Thalassotalea agarivorans]SET42679.1 ATP-dependent RNA helicase RhlE [Thalassotalea agarivorans]
MSFDSLGLSSTTLKAVSKTGYTEPSPIQQKAIPAVLKGKDVMAAAQTGTGKTAAFTLPIIDRLIAKGKRTANQARALVLAPTRELAAQIGESVEKYSEGTDLRSTVVFGGVKINPQMQRLLGGVDILVATPGRLLDLFNQNAVKFDSLEVFVLDEADRMLDMGFIRDIRKIIKLLPQQKQSLMFSATFSPEIKDLAKTIVHHPTEIAVNPENTAAKTVEQWVYPVDKKKKADLVVHLIAEHRWQQLLIFTKTKHGANRLTRYLESFNIKASAIHGNKSQGARTRALAEFKSGEIQVLVATDIAARGLDISQLPQVINYELPNVAEDYVHRIGRTGRAGEAGAAISLVCADELKLLQDIEQVTQQHIPRETIKGYEPVNELGESKPIRPLKKKKPKKPKKPKVKQEQSQPTKTNKPKSGTQDKTKPKRKPKPWAKIRAEKAKKNKNNQ